MTLIIKNSSPSKSALHLHVVNPPHISPVIASRSYICVFDTALLIISDQYCYSSV